MFSVMRAQGCTTDSRCGYRSIRPFHLLIDVGLRLFQSRAADQSQGELRGLRSLLAGKADKDDARPLVSIDSTDRISRGLLLAQSANPQGQGAVA
jgi:hypothetical protein